MFEEISLINKSNKQFRNCFLFFFFIAICAYSSLMTSHWHFRDDFYRFIDNSSIGQSEANRAVPYILEFFIYISGIVTDSTPLTQCISCALLAYIAAIALRIFKVNLESKFEIGCFIPIIVNPYMITLMMVRFDNPFIMLSLLFVMLSAYLSSLNDRKYLLFQIILLMLSLFTYQTALFAYFIVFIYLFICGVRDGQTLYSMLYKMRYWIMTLVATGICYLPFLSFITYFRGNNGDLFINVFEIENLKLIWKNIYLYFSTIYADWSPSPAGNIFFIMLLAFIVNAIVKTVINTKSIGSVLIVVLLSFAFLLSPMGLCLFMVSLNYKMLDVVTRIMYSVGVLISLVLFDNYSLFRRNNTLRIFYKSVIFCFCTWIIIFSNSFNNIISNFRILEEYVFYDIAKDISEITKKNKEISIVYIKGGIHSQAMVNFSKLYPILNKAIPELWSVTDYCRVALMDSEFCKKLMKGGMTMNNINYEKENMGKKKLIKKHMWYDVFICENKLQFILKNTKDDVQNVCIVANIDNGV